tara:strand:+ start:433 stop:672 length:240 start_codon:yes stop_codon:yes gene_type:complete
MLCCPLFSQYYQKVPRVDMQIFPPRAQSTEKKDEQNWLKTRFEYRTMKYGRETAETLLEFDMLQTLHFKELSRFHDSTT